MSRVFLIAAVVIFALGLVLHFVDPKAVDDVVILFAGLGCMAAAAVT